MSAADVLLFLAGIILGGTATAWALLIIALAQVNKIARNTTPATARRDQP